MAANEALGAQWTPITTSELRGDEGDFGGGSRLVSPKHYRRMAKKGRAKLARMGAESRLSGHTAAGLDEEPFHDVVERAWESTREPWGGHTVDSATGKPADFATGFAVSTRMPGQDQLRVRVAASHDQFRNAMWQAKRQYGTQLNRQGHNLGVFRDENATHKGEKGAIDIDPAVVMKRAIDAQQVAAYTHASGGAYDFSTGNAVWPPHVGNRAARRGR